ncbi:hypothetical protein [Leptothoe spongobia]|uniref:Uncharacterized protein n=1 Tax=Leptothoe spongobia TAU-MAC 1115 TaxID=1967444 RepID=A0A947GIR6_9CYAN|nr:hypothetical protein [Leptothoe spongobia]MBT9316435.1 hypothetical protein [Leptothoe spongobia TAU-MAC 1115]
MVSSTADSLEQDVLRSANEQYAVLQNYLMSIESQSLEHGDIESYVQHEGTELLRRLFQAHLDLRGVMEERQRDVIGSDEETRPHLRQRCQRQIESLFGEVVVTRLGYSTKTPGVNTLYPSDGTMNLSLDKYSDGLRRRALSV